MPSSWKVHLDPAQEAAFKERTDLGINAFGRCYADFSVSAHLRVNEGACHNRESMFFTSGKEFAGGVNATRFSS
jgi:hypothetical protein